MARWHASCTTVCGVPVPGPRFSLRQRLGTHPGQGNPHTGSSSGDVPRPPADPERGETPGPERAPRGVMRCHVLAWPALPGLTGTAQCRTMSEVGQAGGREHPSMQGRHPKSRQRLTMMDIRILCMHFQDEMCMAWCYRGAPFSVPTSIFPPLGFPGGLVTGMASV